MHCEDVLDRKRKKIVWSDNLRNSNLISTKRLTDPLFAFNKYIIIRLKMDKINNLKEKEC